MKRKISITEALKKLLEISSSEGYLLVDNGIIEETDYYKLVEYLQKIEKEFL